MFLNRVSLIGFVGNPPRNASTQAGKQVARVSVATTKKYKDQQDQWAGDTQWHDCVAHGRMADSLGRLGKGTHVLIEGELSHRKYERTIETESGPVKVQWPITEIMISNLKVLDRSAKQDEEVSAA